MPEKVVPSEEQREWALRVWEDAREQADRHGSGVIADALAAREASQEQEHKALLNAWETRYIERGRQLSALEAAQVEMQERLQQLAEKVIARGCTCKSSSKTHWHADFCPIPDARAALQTKEEGT